MQLVAYVGERRFDATEMPEASWQALNVQPVYSQLILAECGLRAVRNTRLGTRYFSHYAGLQCAVIHKSESAQHLAVKQAIAERIRNTVDWTAVVEFPAEDRSWIADVMAIHDSGSQIAFEVQLSAQSEHDYINRSQRYSDAGIFVVWLVPSQPFWPRVRLPVIEMGFGKSTELEGNASALLGLQARIPGISNADAPLGCLVDDVLAERVPWPIDSPRAQLDHHRNLEEAREAEARRRKLAAQHFTVEVGRQERLEREAFVDDAQPPSQILGRGFSPTPVSHSLVRVTTVMCGNDHRCFIWQARPALHTIRGGVSGYNPGLRFQ